MEAPEPRPRSTLAALKSGESCRLVSTPAGDAAALARVGLIEGVRAELESHAPFGGPLVIRVGRSRVAVPRDIAQRIEVAALR